MVARIKGPARPITPTAPAHAFTLVEVLVVIAIIGVLTALLLPAVQTAREAGRRLQCANNLKQLALAALNYESVHGLLPASGFAKVEPDRGYPEHDIEIFNSAGGPKLSWVVLLLPFIEEQSLYDQFDLSKSVALQPSQPQQRDLSALLCASGEAPGRKYRLFELTSTALCAKGNYAAYVSPFHVDLQLLYRGALIATGQKLASIEDGTSSTLGFSEVRTLDLATDERGAWALPWTGATLLAFDMHPVGWNPDHDGSGAGDEYVAATRAAYRASRDSVGEAQPPNNQGPNTDTLRACPDDSPQFVMARHLGMPCRKAPWRPGLDGYRSAAPRSNHPGGVNAAYLDGHLNFLPDQVDDFAMAYLVSINDGQASE